MEPLTLERVETGPEPLAGTIWRIDPNRSKIGFSVKHMKFATVRGRFDGFRGTIQFDGDLPVAVQAEIDAATIDTGIKKRDDHLRSADFFDVAVYPTITFRSTRIQTVDPLRRNRWVVTGDLTMHGVTRAVELNVEQPAFSELWDTDTLAFRAMATINRKDFGMHLNLPIEGGGLVVGDEVKIVLNIKASQSLS